MRIKMTALLLSLMIIGGCSYGQSHQNSTPDIQEGHHRNVEPPQERSMMGQMGMGGHRMIELNHSTGTNELNIPPLLESESDQAFMYTIRAKQGMTEIFEGIETTTYGYNGSFLGPMLKFQQGEKVNIKLVNDLDEETTLHWHGLEVAGESDGGPHDVLGPGEEKVIEFDVNQEASTLWFHPHPLSKTARQFYQGLAGLIYVEDENTKNLQLPKDYGENDIPLIFQDKLFDENGQLNYQMAWNPDGTTGNTLLVNGTVNPKLTVKQEQVRLRLLNGSNARNFTFKLNTGASFVQIATDGGLLNEPVKLDEVTLTPSERAEIILDFSAVDAAEELALIDDKGTVLLPFDVKNEKGIQSELPAQLNDFMLTEEEKSLPVTKEIELFGHMNMVMINGKKFDPNRMDLQQKQGVTEVWEIYNKPDMMGGMVHPFHVHGTQFKIVSRDGKAPSEHEQGWKDSISVEPGERVKIAIQFKEKGVYMFHCHILEHEDNGMMGQIKVD